MSIYLSVCLIFYILLVRGRCADFTMQQIFPTNFSEGLLISLNSQSWGKQPKSNLGRR